MRTDNLVRGFGEIDDRLIEEVFRIEDKEALAKKRKGEKIMKITGITAACTAAAALLAVTLFPGLFRQREVVPLGPAVTSEPKTTEAVTDAEEFSSAIAPTMDFTLNEEIYYRGEPYRFEGFIGKPEGLAPVSAGESRELDGVLSLQNRGEDGMTEVPLTAGDFSVYAVEGNEKILVLEYVNNWLLYRVPEPSVDDTEPAPVETEQDGADLQETEEETPEDIEKPSDKWVTAKAMQQLDAQFLYTYTEYDDFGIARDTRVRVLPLLFEDDSVPVDWVIPREGETIGNTIAKLGDYLYFTRSGNLNADICRKSFVTQEEEILYSTERGLLMEYTDLNGEQRQLYETVFLLAVSDEKILFGIGEDGYSLNVYLYEVNSGSLTDLGMRGGAHIVSIDTLPGDEKVCFTFDGGTHDVSASKLWVVSEDGTVFLDRYSFTNGAKNGFLYYRDDVTPGGRIEEETTVSIHRYCFADGSDEIVFGKTLQNYLLLQLRGGLIWTYDTDTEEAVVFDPDSPEREIILPDGNGNVLKAGELYFTVTGDAVYTLDPGSGTCVKAADLESGSEGYTITQFLYAEDQGVLIYITGYGNAMQLHRLVL